jgi:hypothetical protein
MLQFSNGALAQLCIAATAVHRKQRGAWLRQVASRIETGTPAGDAVADPAAEAKRRAKRKAARLRQRKRRLRAKAHYRVATVEVSPDEEQYLRDVGVLMPWHEVDNSKVLGTAIKLLLAELVAKSR